MKIHRIIVWLFLALNLAQCGRKSDDDGGAGVPFIPAGWDGSGDYDLSTWEIETA